jgi:hypothetical protein
MGNPSIMEPGAWLAHYTSAATAFEHIIPTGKLRLSPYRMMRDPAENQDIFFGTAFFGAPEEPQEQWERGLAEVKLLRDRVRLLSLTQDVDYGAETGGRFGCCWARPRVWEQYADAHRGVCLVFRRDALVEAISGALGAENVRLDEVRYTPEGIAGSRSLWVVTDTRLHDAKTRKEAIEAYVADNYDDLFFLKADDWATEHEFRALLVDADDEYAFAGYASALHTVVLGKDFPDWQIPGAAAMAEAHGAEVKKAFWDKGRPLALKPSGRDRSLGPTVGHG